ncbi:Acetoacetyl-CoA reductase OS=Castellaniella defragrans OX=75697 GN=HNR28_003206 PE=3 SV=1 [Castellaniella defragrans]
MRRDRFSRDTQSPDPHTHAGHFTPTDVTNEASVAAACTKTVADLGRLDILVHCAGITGPTASVEDYTLSDWLRVLNINLTGTFLCNRAVIGHMKRQNYGRIVNLASIAGKEGNALQSAYSASKAGVIALTKSLGKELCAYPITVNCIAPAMVETPLLMQMTPEKRKENFAKIPMGRAGTVAEIASLALWLASPECSFSTGAAFDASGGRATY